MDILGIENGKGTVLDILYECDDMIEAICGKCWQNDQDNNDRSDSCLLRKKSCWYYEKIQQELKPLAEALTKKIDALGEEIQREHDQLKEEYDREQQREYDGYMAMLNEDYIRDCCGSWTPWRPEYVDY